MMALPLVRVNDGVFGARIDAAAALNSGVSPIPHSKHPFSGVVPGQTTVGGVSSMSVEMRLPGRGVRRP
jgi:hypothetical protein